MNSIIDKLSDPGNWVAGILFSLIAAIIYKLGSMLPSVVRGYSRSRRLININQVRKQRVNPLEVTYAIGKANAQFVAFLLMCFFYLAALLVSETLREIANQSIILVLILASPIFVFEIFWLFQDSRAKRLVTEHGKILNYRQRQAITRRVNSHP
ncbi:putative membrane protein YqjE [Spongiibacter marinus]|nr:putative membrane protein YqjE [Spongiibacter marinus]